MEFLTALILIFLVAAVMGPKKKRRRRGKHRTGSGTSRPTPAGRLATREPKPDPYLFLYEHWSYVKNHPSSVPRWYNDPVTEAQLERLRDDNIKLPGRPLSKGQASDLIGLGEMPETHELEILKFFKVKGLPLKHGSIARIEIGRLLDDPDNASAWINRPATAIQKEFYRFLGRKIPPKLTASEAEDFMKSYQMTDSQEDDWSAYESILDDLSEPEFRADYDIKKPSLPLIRQAIEAKTNEGFKLRDLLADDLIDTLIELKPDLQRD